MERKPKISPTHTFVFDDDDIEALDELSITTVIGEVTDSIRKRDLESTEVPRAEESAAAEGTKPKSPKPPEFDEEIMDLMREINDEK